MEAKLDRESIRAWLRGRSRGARALVGAAALATLGPGGSAVPPARVVDALAQQQQLLAERPGEADLLNDLGNLQVLAGELAAAESSYRSALEAQPESARIRYNLALLLQQLGRLDEAMTELERVVAAEPSHAWAHYQTGVLLEAEGKDKPAVEAYATAFALDPQLTFAEHNPHVIDNRLYTQALLRAFEPGTDNVLAPRSYREADRISSLLLPPRRPPMTSEAAAAQRRRKPGEAEVIPAVSGPSGPAPPPEEPDSGGFFFEDEGEVIDEGADPLDEDWFEEEQSLEFPEDDLGEPLQPQQPEQQPGSLVPGQESQPGVLAPPPVQGPADEVPDAFRSDTPSTGRLELRLEAPVAPAGP